MHPHNDVRGGTGGDPSGGPRDCLGTLLWIPGTVWGPFRGSPRLVCSVHWHSVCTFNRCKP